MASDDVLMKAFEDAYETEMMNQRSLTPADLTSMQPILLPSGDHRPIHYEDVVAILKGQHVPLIADQRRGWVELSQSTVEVSPSGIPRTVSWTRQMPKASL